MASIKRILRSYPRKNYKNFNWNGSFICPKIHSPWLKLALWSRIAYFTAMNLIVTFSPVVNAQCQSNMTSMRQILRSYPWKNYKNLNWNRSFICPKKYFAWLKLALWSRIACFAALNLWHFRRLSTLNASQPWLQSNEYCAQIRGKIIKISTEIGHLYAPKNIFLA